MYRAHGTHFARTGSIFEAHGLSGKIYVQDREIGFGPIRYAVPNPEKPRIPIERVDVLPPPTVIDESVLVRQPNGTFKSELTKSLQSNQPEDRMLLLKKPYSQMSKRNANLQLPVGVYKGDLGAATKDQLALYLADQKVIPSYIDGLHSMSKQHLLSMAAEYNKKLMEGEPDPKVKALSQLKVIPVPISKKAPKLSSVDQTYLSKLSTMSDQDVLDEFNKFFKTPPQNLPKKDMVRAFYQIYKKGKEGNLTGLKGVNVSLSKPGLSEAKKIKGISII